MDASPYADQTVGPASTSMDLDERNADVLRRHARTRRMRSTTLAAAPTLHAADRPPVPTAFIDHRRAASPLSTRPARAVRYDLSEATHGKLIGFNDRDVSAPRLKCGGGRARTSRPALRGGPGRHPARRTLLRDQPHPTRNSSPMNSGSSMSQSSIPSAAAGIQMIGQTLPWLPRTEKT